MIFSAKWSMVILSPCIMYFFYIINHLIKSLLNVCIKMNWWEWTTLSNSVFDGDLFYIDLNQCMVTMLSSYNFHIALLLWYQMPLTLNIFNIFCMQLYLESQCFSVMQRLLLLPFWNPNQSSVNVFPPFLQFYLLWHEWETRMCKLPCWKCHTVHIYLLMPSWNRNNDAFCKVWINVSCFVNRTNQLEKMCLTVSSESLDELCQQTVNPRYLY